MTSPNAGDIDLWAAFKEQPMGRKPLTFMAFGKPAPCGMTGRRARHPPPPAAAASLLIIKDGEGGVARARRAGRTRTAA